MGDQKLMINLEWPYSDPCIQTSHRVSMQLQESCVATKAHVLRNYKICIQRATASGTGANCVRIIKYLKLAQLELA